MKKNLLLIILLVSLNMFSQNKNDEQSNNFNEAENFLKLSKQDNINLYGAINYFFMAYFHNTENNLGIISKNKIDSIKPIIRSILVSKWNGKWKRINPNSSSKENTFIEISNNKLLVYSIISDSSERKIILNEKIKFYESKLENIVVVDEFWDFELPNKEIWYFVMTEEINKEFLYMILRTDKNGITRIKHRSIYRDDREVNIYKNEIKYERVK